MEGMGLLLRPDRSRPGPGGQTFLAMTSASSELSVAFS